MRNDSNQQNRSAEGESTRCREKALSLLDKRMHSCDELRQKLQQRGFPKDAVSDTIAELEGTGILDDTEYARTYIRQAITGPKPKGRSRVVRELQQRGIDQDTARQALTDVFNEGTDTPDAADTELGLARQAAQTKYRALTHQSQTDPSKQRDKLYRFLARRGFEADVCRTVVDELFPD